MYIFWGLIITAVLSDELTLHVVHVVFDGRKLWGNYSSV